MPPVIFVVTDGIRSTVQCAIEATPNFVNLHVYASADPSDPTKITFGGYLHCDPVTGVLSEVKDAASPAEQFVAHGDLLVNTPIWPTLQPMWAFKFVAA